MIEEILHLFAETRKARSPGYCIFEVWESGVIQPCNRVIWDHKNLCLDHEPLVESLPWEYRFKPKAGSIKDNKKWRNAFYNMSSRFDPVHANGTRGIERILGKERKKK